MLSSLHALLVSKAQRERERGRGGKRPLSFSWEGEDISLTNDAVLLVAPFVRHGRRRGEAASHHKFMLPLVSLFLLLYWVYSPSVLWACDQIVRSEEFQSRGWHTHLKKGYFILKLIVLVCLVLWAIKPNWSHFSHCTGGLRPIWPHSSAAELPRFGGGQI